MPRNPPLSPAVAYLGGTFDPIHFGHLRLAEELYEQLQLTGVNLLPCHIPPHKASPQVNAVTRSQMLSLATEDNPNLHVDLRELSRSTPSYTIDTLRELRAENPDAPIIFAIGMDSFLSLHRWHEWQQLLNYCHLVVFSRPGYDFNVPTPLQSITSKIVSSHTALHQHTHGLIWCYQHLILNISSSDIRENQRQSRSNRYLIPSKVLQYITDNSLYQ